MQLGVSAPIGRRETIGRAAEVANWRPFALAHKSLVRWPASGLFIPSSLVNLSPLLFRSHWAELGKRASELARRASLAASLRVGGSNAAHSRAQLSGLFGLSPAVRCQTGGQTDGQWQSAAPRGWSRSKKTTLVIWPPHVTG